MKPDDFEQHLARQPLRQIPTEWREKILAECESGRSAAVAPSAVPRPTHWLRDLLWPYPYAWASLAAVWMVILALHFSSYETKQFTRTTPPITPEMILLARAQQQRLLGEINGAGERFLPANTPPPSRPIGPQGEWKTRRIIA